MKKLLVAFAVFLAFVAWTTTPAGAGDKPDPYPDGRIAFFADGNSG